LISIFSVFYISLLLSFFLQLSNVFRASVKWLEEKLGRLRVR
jgi:hypothetical protein